VFKAKINNHKSEEKREQSRHASLPKAAMSGRKGGGEYHEQLEAETTHKTYQLSGKTYTI